MHISTSENMDISTAEAPVNDRTAQRRRKEFYFAVVMRESASRLVPRKNSLKRAETIHADKNSTRKKKFPFLNISYSNPRNCMTGY